MNKTKIFSDLENANAIRNGQEDCSSEFVDLFVDLHKKPIDNDYLYDFILRSFMDIIKIDHSVLYVACGTAGFARLFKNIKRFVGIDHSKKMIEAAKKLNQNPGIDYNFYNTNFEHYSRDEKFDIIYLGPYGHYVPYTYEVLEKAKKLLKDDGMLFCTLPDPGFTGLFSRAKEIIKQVLYNRTLEYDQVKIAEKLFKSSDLDSYCKIKIKTSMGYSFCYVLKKQ